MKKFVVFAAILFLCQCKKDEEKPYPNENIVTDNAQASLYFHTVFREVVNAWHYIDQNKYEEGQYVDAGTSYPKYKGLTYNKSINPTTVTIEYNSWETNSLMLSGTITVRFDVHSYHSDGKVATVSLTDFSINQQYVVGGSTVKFNKKLEEKDSYTYTLLEGAAIHEKGYSMPVLISAAIANGQYERIEGSETLNQNDDVWLYSGVMTGMLHNDPDLKYTNTVNPTSTYRLEDGSERNGRVLYSMNCKFAEKGLSQITFSKRPAIGFIYSCLGYSFFSVTLVD